MNLSVLFAALAALPLDHKRACAISLDSFIKKDEAELRIAQGEFGVTDQLLEVLSHDGGTPIAPKRFGKKPDPKSKSSRIRAALIPFMEENGGKIASNVAITFLKETIPGVTTSDIYKSSGQFVKEGTLRRDYGEWSLVSGLQATEEKVA